MGKGLTKPQSALLKTDVEFWTLDLHRFLAVADGVVRAQGRKIIFTTNLPTTYEAIDKDVRRVVANRFPFSVYFRAEERRIVVLAVFHGRRNPVIWQHRT
jgi:plasmid stabilization system protein ParE